MVESFATLLELLENDESETQVEMDVLERLGSSGTLDDVLLYAARAGALIDATNTNGRTLIEEAARYNNLVVVRFCIEKGSQPFDAMHYAAMNEGREVVDYLLSLGGYINALNKDGETPLDLVWIDSEFRAYMVSCGAREGKSGEGSSEGAGPKLGTG